MTNLVVAGNTIQRQSFGRHDAQICGRRKILFIQRWRRNTYCLEKYVPVNVMYRLQWHVILQCDHCHSKQVPMDDVHESHPVSSI